MKIDDLNLEYMILGSEIDRDDEVVFSIHNGSSRDTPALAWVDKKAAIKIREHLAKVFDL